MTGEQQTLRDTFYLATAFVSDHKIRPLKIATGLAN